MSTRTPSRVGWHPNHSTSAHLSYTAHHAFPRDKQGHEIDAIIKTGPDTFHTVEMKSGETIAADFFTNLDDWRTRLTRQSITPWLIHGGTTRQDRQKATVLPWNNLSPLWDDLA